MEKIIIKVEVDGIELSPIFMGEGAQDNTYPSDINFFSIGNLLDAEKKNAPYSYVFRLTRHKTKEESKK